MKNTSTEIKEEDLSPQEIAEATESTTDVSKCPTCGANLVYSPTDKTLVCEYCGYSKKIDFTNLGEEKSFSELLKTDNSWAEDARVFVCNNCGAQQVLSKNEISVKCSFCGTTNVVEKNDILGLKPNALLPFLIDSAAAGNHARTWAKKRWLAPRSFKKSVNPENIHGNYIPAFTFDSLIKTHYEGRLGKDHTVTVRVNGKTVTRTETKWFHVSGYFEHFFNDVLIQASDSISQKSINKISPFDTDHSQQYKNEFLHGFTASQYSKDGETCWKEAKGVMQNATRSMILSKYDYDRVDYLNFPMSYEAITYKYLLLPIYVGHFSFRQKLYNFFVNGQNGKVTGKTPLSPLRVGLLVLLGLVAAAGIVALIIINGGF